MIASSTTLLALLFERIAGYPEPVFQRIGHPVTWAGALIGGLERRMNAGGPTRRRVLGVLALLVLIAAAVLAGLVVTALARTLGPLGIVLVGIAASTLIAQRSLGQHVEDVATALERGGLAEGRVAVARIVGRDPERLDTAGVARAAIESLAENYSDGIVAPVFWLWLGGLPAGAAYKAINTADSMIGHRSERYRAYGWSAARLDDLVNLPASRLAALTLIAAAAIVPGASPARAWRAIVSDARAHRSRTRDGPRPRWPVRSASLSPDRDTTTARWSMTRSWAAAGAGIWGQRTSAAHSGSTGRPTPS